MMKKLLTKNWLMISLLVIALLILPQTVNAASTLPEENSGKIVLTENVTLEETAFVVESGKTLTIDLNGYTLTGPEGYYTINNEGTLTIVDNGSTKGKIVGQAPESSCIRNAGTIIVDGVKIESAFVALKNEETGNMTVKNSDISSTYSGYLTGAILNWGAAAVKDSTITAPSGPAFYATSGYETAKDSTLDIEGNTINAKYMLYSK